MVDLAGRYRKEGPAGLLRPIFQHNARLVSAADCPPSSSPRRPKAPAVPRSLSFCLCLCLCPSRSLAPRLATNQAPHRPCPLHSTFCLQLQPGQGSGDARPRCVPEQRHHVHGPLARRRPGRHGEFSSLVSWLPSMLEDSPTNPQNTRTRTHARTHARTCALTHLRTLPTLVRGVPGGSGGEAAPPGPPGGFLCSNSLSRADGVVPMAGRADRGAGRGRCRAAVPGRGVLVAWA